MVGNNGRRGRIRCRARAVPVDAGRTVGDRRRRRPMAAHPNPTSDKVSQIRIEQMIGALALLN